MKKQNKICFFLLAIMGVFLILTNSCKKNEETSTVPVLTTSAVSNTTQTTASCGGNITSDGGSPVTARGVCWSTATNPTIEDNITIDGTDIGSFTSNLTGLSANTTYYVRAYATNSAGTGYGEQIQFTTLVDYTGQTGTVNDIDGNTYPTIGIGGQIWMSENLKTTKYNDNSTIPLVTDASAWAALTTPAYCWYNNDAATNKATYGALYNWYTVDVASNGGKNVCPTGWHVPTDTEWFTLTTYLGGESVAGGKLKETGLTHWITPNTGATNETGFAALPGGFHHYNGTYNDIGNSGAWWSSIEYSSTTAWSRFMNYDGTSVDSYDGNKLIGFSVRCLRDF